MVGIFLCFFPHNLQHLLYITAQNDYTNYSNNKMKWGTVTEGSDGLEDLKKIRIMTNLAIYDKLYGEEDRKITAHYRRDYVYKKNLSIRIGVLLGCAVLLMLYYGYKLFVAGTDLFVIVSKQEAVKIGVAVVVLIVVYTIIGTIINRARYSLAEERCVKYEKMVSRLYEDKSKNLTYDKAKNERT